MQKMGPLAQVAAELWTIEFLLFSFRAKITGPNFFLIQFSTSLDLKAQFSRYIRSFSHIFRKKGRKLVFSSLISCFVGFFASRVGACFTLRSAGSHRFKWVLQESFLLQIVQIVSSEKIFLSWEPTAELWAFKNGPETKSRVFKRP